MWKPVAQIEPDLPVVRMHGDRLDIANLPRANVTFRQADDHGCWVLGSGCQVQGSRFRVQGSRFRVPGSGFQVLGSVLGTNTAFSPYMGVRRYQDLDCWKLSNELKRRIYDFTAKPPASRDLKYCDQIRDCARSAPRTIAEGFGRFRPTDQTLRRCGVEGTFDPSRERPTLEPGTRTLNLEP